MNTDNDTRLYWYSVSAKPLPDVPVASPDETPILKRSFRQQLRLSILVIEKAATQ